MKKLIYILMITAASLTMVGCEQEVESLYDKYVTDDSENEEDNFFDGEYDEGDLQEGESDDEPYNEPESVDWVISATITSSEIATEWSEDAVIGLFATDDSDSSYILDNAKYLNDAASEVANFTIYKYLKTDDGFDPLEVLAEEVSYSILAYSPYDESLSSSYSKILLSFADQSKSEALNLMVGSVSNVAGGGATTSLEFAHVLSRVAVNISADDTISASELASISVTISGMVAGATYDLLGSQSLSVLDANYDGMIDDSDKADIAMSMSDDGSVAEAFVMPSSDLDLVTVEFALNAQETIQYTLNELFSTSELNGGSSYTANVTLSRDSDSVGGTVTLNPWN